MNKELKDKWVAALRSGKYKQGKYRLRTGDDCFCCLGVLCDVIDPAGWQHTVYTYKGRKRVEMLPDTLEKDVNLKLQLKLGRMNDNDVSFLEIANYIEEYVEIES